MARTDESGQSAVGNEDEPLKDLQEHGSGETQQRSGTGRRPGEEAVPLSERGGIERAERDPDDFNDRTRDREVEGDTA